MTQIPYFKTQFQLINFDKFIAGAKDVEDFIKEFRLTNKLTTNDTRIVVTFTSKQHIDIDPYVLYLLHCQYIGLFRYLTPHLVSPAPSSFSCLPCIVYLSHVSGFLLSFRVLSFFTGNWVPHLGYSLVSIRLLGYKGLMVFCVYRLVTGVDLLFRNFVCLVFKNKNYGELSD